MALEIIDIRQFETREFAPLLEAESQVWAASLKWDHTASARMISACLDEKRLSGYAVVNKGQIKGYSFFFYESDKGLIGNLFVAPGEGGLNEAVLLLEHVIETLLATPGLSRVEAQLPLFSLQELEPCFRDHCFKGYLRRFMAISLTNRSPSAGLASPERSGSAPEAFQLPAEFLLEPWQRKHDQQAAQLLYNTYRHHVDAAINDQYCSLAGATRLVENIVHHRGCGEPLPQASRVAIHRPTRKLAAILALTAVGPHTAHIPQVAVTNGFQGRGLGTALMELSFRDVAAEGFQEVTLTVTDLNAGAVRLYERLGFETIRTFGAFVWNRR